jgi:hypothetical protein
VRGAAVIPLVLLGLVAGGCGGDKQAPASTAQQGAASVAPRRVSSFVRVSFPEQGVSFGRPDGWKYEQGAPPLLATMSSGEVTIAVWRYPRSGTLPRTLAQLTAAKDELLRAARARDRTLKVVKAKGTRAAHHPAVVIVAGETVAGDRRTVRSTHVYADGGEVVVDAFASPAQFPKVEDPVFRQVVRSLRVVAPSS